jgi:hypothetical protein
MSELRVSQLPPDNARRRTPFREIAFQSATSCAILTLMIGNRNGSTKASSDSLPGNAAPRDVEAIARDYGQSDKI